MAAPFAIHRRPGARVDTVGKTLGAFGRLGDVRVRRLCRHPTSIRVGLSVFRLDGSLYDGGSAALLDLSSEGARIGDLRLPLGEILPLGFQVALRLGEGASPNKGIQGEIVWFEPGDRRRYGIRFLPV